MPLVFYYELYFAIIHHIGEILLLHMTNVKCLNGERLQMIISNTSEMKAKEKMSNLGKVFSYFTPFLLLKFHGFFYSLPLTTFVRTIYG